MSDQGGDKKHEHEREKPPSGQTVEPEDGGDADAKKHNRYFGLSGFEFWSVVFQGLVATATVIYTVLSLWQLSLMQKALDSNERAWLIAGSATLSFTDDGFIVNVLFRNHGKSPAFKGRHIINRTDRLSAPTSAIDASADLVRPVGTDVESKKTFSGFRKDRLDRMIRGSEPVVIWFRVEYSDPFSDTRYTQQCWVYNTLKERLVLCPPGHDVFR